jgi:hypothetical protein
VNVGMPATGLGGIFYLLSTLLMVLVEITRTIKGESSLARWRRVLAQVAISAGIVLSFVVTVFGVSRLLALWPGAWFAMSSLGSRDVGSFSQGLVHYLPLIMITLSPFLVVMLSVQVLRLVLIFRGRRDALPPRSL